MGVGERREKRQKRESKSKAIFYWEGGASSVFMKGEVNRSEVEVQIYLLIYLLRKKYMIN